MSATSNPDTPLFVDLDGTLIATDAMWASLRQLLRERPLVAVALPFALLRGRAALKDRLARLVSLDPASLPYRDDVLEFLRAEKATGRQIILATAADGHIARGVAAHLGLFDDVMASDGAYNMKGRNKLTAILERTGGGAFDYVGDSRADIPILEASRVAHLAYPSARLLRRACETCRLGRVFQ